MGERKGQKNFTTSWGGRAQLEGGGGPREGGHSKRGKKYKWEESHLESPGGGEVKKGGLQKKTKR